MHTCAQFLQTSDFLCDSYHQSGCFYLLDIRNVLKASSSFPPPEHDLFIIVSFLRPPGRRRDSPALVRRRFMKACAESSPATGAGWIPRPLLAATCLRRGSAHYAILSIPDPTVAIY